VPDKRQILIASRSLQATSAVHALIDNSDWLSIETRVIDDRQRDPLHGLASHPDVVLFRINGNSVRELDELAPYFGGDRPPLIVVGDAGHPECMRAAMRAGARDFLTQPVSRAELLTTIARVADENTQAKRHSGGRITALVNAKGGSGATFIACSIAHLFAGPSKIRTVLMDLDLQAAALPRYLDIEPKRSLLEAVEVASDLDGTAIEAYLTKHASGLAVLSGLRDGAMLQQDRMLDRFDRVLNLLVETFERLIIDVPRQLDPFNARVLERSHQIVLVLQQSVPSLHEAARMYELITRNLAIARGQITILVNRYHKKAPVELSAIEQSFGDSPTICIPNDYDAVTESINLGVPIHEQARRSSVTKALLHLQKELGGGEPAATKRLFFPMLRRAGP
jgi:pilus assembly protein CpaE